MTEVRPFRALRYDPARVDLSRVIVPPYDVVAAEDRAGFFERDPHNAIRLELTRDVADEASTDYHHVRETLETWIAQRVLTRDAEPALYPLRQTFTAPDGTRLAREGFFALLHLEDYARRIVRPHERTLAGPKADRLEAAARGARESLGGIPALRGPRARDRAAAARCARARIGRHRARRERGRAPARAARPIRAAIGEVARFLADRPVVIADGHHRYETALSYRDERRAAGDGDGPDAPHEWLLVYLANAFAPGSSAAADPPPRSEGRAADREPGCASGCRAGRAARCAIADPGELTDLLARHLEPLRDRHAFAADDASGAAADLLASAQRRRAHRARDPPRGDRGRVRARRGRRARGRDRLSQVRAPDRARSARGSRRGRALSESAHAPRTCSA